MTRQIRANCVFSPRIDLGSTFEKVDPSQEKSIPELQNASIEFLTAPQARDMIILKARML